MVLGVAGCGRVDVHSQHSEPLRHLPGPLRGRHPARHLPQHHVHEAGQGAHRERLGAQLRHLLPSAARLEGGGGHHQQHAEQKSDREERYIVVLGETADSGGRDRRERTVFPRALVLPSLSLDLRADERDQLRHLLSTRLLLHTDASHDVLLLEDLPSRCADDESDQPGLQNNQGDESLRE